MDNNKDLHDLKVGDKITLYGISESAMSINKREFEVNRPPSNVGGSSFAIVCYAIGRNGRICDWYGHERTYCLIWRDKYSYFETRHSNSLLHFYTDPKIPCEMVIKNLREEKRKINKKIMDCQRFMYQVEEV
jgi:hypothetical protein